MRDYGVDSDAKAWDKQLQGNDMYSEDWDHYDFEDEPIPTTQPAYTCPGCGAEEYEVCKVGCPRRQVMSQGFKGILHSDGSYTDLTFKQEADPYETTETEVTEGGGKHTKLNVRCDLLPADAILQLAVVLAEGAKKYGVNNWRGIPQEANVNHMLAHLLRFIKDGNPTDLLHATCRGLFALETKPGTEASWRRERPDTN